MSYSRDIEMQGTSDDEPVAMAAKKKTPVPKQQATIPPNLPLGGLPPGFPARVPGMPDFAPRRNSNLVITMGLDNFESHPKGRSTSILADYIIAEYAGQSSMVSVEDDAHVIKEALRASRPDLFKDRRIVLIDCRTLNGPRATRHIGIHPNILDATADSPAFLHMDDAIGAITKATGKDDVPAAYVCFCRSGRHRSVAVATGLQSYLLYAQYGVGLCPS